MMENSPVFTEDGAYLYRFTFLAAKELLLTALTWRNSIESHGPGQLDLLQGERELKGATRSLEISLTPPVVDGTFIDPRDNPDWRDLSNVRQVNISQELAQSRDGTFSALGFAGQSAHEVVLRLGQETLHAVRILAQSQDRQTLGYLCGPESPLQTEAQGLGAIPVAKANLMEAECLREAEQAWRREKAGRASGDDDSSKTIIEASTSLHQSGSEQPTEPTADNKPANRKEYRAAWIGKALMLRKEHPNISKAEIARRVGVHAGQLSPRRFPELAELEKMLQSKPPSGHITADSESGLSDVEAAAPTGNKPDCGIQISGSSYFREYCSVCGEPIRVEQSQVGKKPRCADCAE